MGGEPVATAYLADLPEVAEAKAAFQAVFDKYAAGEVALPVAPVHEVPAVVAPAVAPVAVAAPYWNAAYPYAAAAYTGYAGYAGYYGYPYGYYGKGTAGELKPITFVASIDHDQSQSELCL